MTKHPSFNPHSAPVFLDLQATVDKAIALVDLLGDTPDKAQLFRTGVGYSMIFAPDGSPLCKH